MTPNPLFYISIFNTYFVQHHKQPVHEKILQTLIAQSVIDAKKP